MGHSMITMTTDFGWRDGFVGTMKGVILKINPRARILDLSHGVVPFSRIHAALILRSSLRFFSLPAVHLVVVDPGVGTSRRALAADTSMGTLVLPDNGLLSMLEPVIAVHQVVQICPGPYTLDPISDTFHGRDVFAPAAAHCSKGVSILSMGSQIDDWVRESFPQAIRGPKGEGRGEILVADHFGNLVTSIPNGWAITDEKGVGSTLCWSRGGQCPVKRTFGDVKSGNPVAVRGSSGYLELAIREGSASEVLGLSTGAHVWLNP